MLRRKKSVCLLLCFASATQFCKCCFASATHPALRAPLSERGWLRSTSLCIYCCIKQPNIQTATAPSPLGEGCPKGGVCRTLKPSLSKHHSQTTTRTPPLSNHHSQTTPRRPLPRHPLSERGEGTASGRSDSEAVNKRAGCVALLETSHC